MKLAFLALILTTTLVFGQIDADDNLVLDNNQFMIYNKHYHKARLAQWGTGSYDAGTYEHSKYPDQLWTLEPHPTKKGCYYIVNEVHSQHRIADWEHKFIVYNGPHFPDQLFKFIPSGHDDGFYYINSCHYTNDRIAKYGVKDSAMAMYSGPRYPDQLWRLVPRLTALIRTEDVFHLDNRQGSSPITREISVTTGIKRSSTTTIRSKITYRQSLEASISIAAKAADLGLKSTMEFTAELETIFSETQEENWSKTENIRFTIPAYKNFKVMQHVVDFEGIFNADSCSLLTSIKIFESRTAEFKDPDNFIIPYRA